MLAGKVYRLHPLLESQGFTDIFLIFQAVGIDRYFLHENRHHPMLDGFNEGWIDFRDRGAHARKGRVGIDEAVASLVARKDKPA